MEPGGHLDAYLGIEYVSIVSDSASLDARMEGNFSGNVESGTDEHTTKDKLHHCVQVRGVADKGNRGGDVLGSNKLLRLPYNCIRN